MTKNHGHFMQDATPCPPPRTPRMRVLPADEGFRAWSAPVLAGRHQILTSDRHSGPEAWRMKEKIVPLRGQETNPELQNRKEFRVNQRHSGA